MGLTRAEQETVIRWDEDVKAVQIWTASPVTWRKLARIGVRPTRETTMAGQPSGKFYTVPFASFRWGLKRKGGSQGNAEGLTRARELRKQTREAQAGDAEAAP